MGLVGLGGWARGTGYGDWDGREMDVRWGLGFGGAGRVGESLRRGRKRDNVRGGGQIDEEVGDYTLK